MNCCIHLKFRKDTLVLGNHFHVPMNGGIFLELRHSPVESEQKETLRESKRHLGIRKSLKLPGPVPEQFVCFNTPCSCRAMNQNFIAEKVEGVFVANGLGRCCI